ncbi:Uncharacterised protein [Mycobacteroides abscessus subsp. abscessus]|nr:Uncharacterised protein [Mycobacteroides abscessus subsp. abscessus]
MPGHDYLRYRRHADCVTAHSAEHPHFCRRFICRAGIANIYTFLDADIQLACNLSCLLAQIPGVCFRHIRKTDAKLGVIRSNQRIASHIVDMVRDKH